MTIVLRHKNTGKEVTKFFVTEVEQTEARIIIQFDNRIGTLRGCSVLRSEYEIAKIA